MKPTSYVWAVLASIMVACATAPLPPSRSLEPGDLKMLAGRWDGSGLTAGKQQFRFVWVVREDGTFTTTSGAGTTDGRMSIQGGKVLLEGAFADYVLTLHDGDGRRILRGTGRFRGGVGSSEAEVEATRLR